MRTMKTFNLKKAKSPRAPLFQRGGGKSVLPFVREGHRGLGMFPPFEKGGWGGILSLVVFAFMVSTLPARAAGPNYFSQGVDMYKAGRYSEATEAFENAVKKRDRAEDSQRYIERIRKETVERIRNRALTGVSKTTWQNKFYFINNVGGRVRVGLSSQELFERQSLHFRPGAADALMQLAGVLQRNDNAVFDVKLISEVAQNTPESPELVNQQLVEVFSFLSLAAQDSFPRY